MDQFHHFHAKIQTLSNLNERIVNSHFPDEIGRCVSRPQRLSSQGGWSRQGASENTGSGTPDLPPTTTTTPPPPRGPPALRPRLPMEVVELILRNLSKRQLLPVLLANKALHSVAIALLYREMVESRPAQCVLLVRRLLQTPAVHRHVRKLDINISTLECPTGNFYRLLQALLRRTTTLTHLSLDFPKAHSPVWILDGCVFSLRQFSTSMHSSSELARFLEGQAQVTHLTLRGFQSDALKSLPYIYMDIANSISPGLLVSRDSSFEQFVLGRESLKKLAVFNAIHAGPMVVRAVVEGRPVHTASIPLFSTNAVLSLDALESSAVPMKRLSVISFDPNAPHFIFEEVAKRFTELEALHIVVLLAEFTNELLLAACPFLSSFKKLKYITCVATSTEESTYAEEKEIAEKWHEKCATLKTIILPRGRVWFHKPSLTPGAGSWECLED
ncbi:hypothetical protein EST38_g11086 [Candolleomyces aberdarensis]|uniref:F-box domain-containing protein n=1 Tax=Candolleomyces aberdarensis TaxID=2316362 RepID=A0A4Q2D5Q5_9AGAR|nr:hypothetical protein EST38_g11086 [Candolleomyces aberdarensis]